MTESVRYRMLDYLANENAVHNTFTAAQARARFRIENVSSQIHKLRTEGFSIYTNTKKLSDGRRIQFYRLGSPSKRFLRNMKAGRVSEAVACLS